VIQIDPINLKSQMELELEKRKVQNSSIFHCVNSLIQTSLRGVDSHGIHLFPHYCRAVESGRINGSAKMSFTKTAASTGILDAQDAFGHHSGAYAMEKAIELAKESGMGAVGIKNSTHFGAAAYFAQMAAEKGCIGWSFTNADALVKANNSKEAFFGTNPVCFSAPMKNEGPFCLDMATSKVSWNKIKNYRTTNSPIPKDWAFNSEGIPVENPNEATSLNPTGDYKGFGLGMMVDILCAVLTNGLISKDLSPMFTSPIEEKRKVSHFVMAMDISKFSKLEDFKESLQDMADRIRELPKLSETDVMIAGDPEKKSFIDRSTNGIPVPEENWLQFLDINQDFRKAEIISHD
jgi:ureidoglycolate dehydrogenase (NAD+)